MHRIEEELFPPPVPPVTGDQPILEDQPHLIDGGGDRDLTIRILRRYRIAVGVESDQRQRIGIRLAEAARLEGLLWQGPQEALLFFSQECLLGRGLAPQLARQVVPAVLGQLTVQRCQGIDSRHGNQIIPAREVQQPLDVPLLVRSSNQTEMILEQEVTLQTQALSGGFPLTAADKARDSDLRIAKASMSASFLRPYHGDISIGHQGGHFYRGMTFSVQPDIGEPEIGLGFPRRM